MLDLVSEQIVLEIYPGLLSVLIQCIKNRLKIRHRRLELGGLVYSSSVGVLGRSTENEQPDGLIRR